MHRFLIAFAALGCAFTMAACGSGSHSTSATTATTASTSVPLSTAVSSTSTTTSLPPATTPLIVVPPYPQSSPDQASTVFMNAWMGGNRASASGVGTASAVSTIFATPYRGQPLNNRGCSDAFPPVVCTWGPYAGGEGSIYQVQIGGGGTRWYVSSVMVES